MATMTMTYRQTGVMCANPTSKSKLTGLRINTNPNALGICLKPTVPPRRNKFQRIWNRLPENVLNLIAKDLHMLDLINLGLTCRSAYKAVTLINSLLLVRRQHFTNLFKHLSYVARVYDGRASFITDSDEILDEIVASLRVVYGDAKCHRSLFYSDFECDFILDSLVKDDAMIRDLFIDDMLAVFGHMTRSCYWEEEREGPPTTPEDEFYRSPKPRHGIWFRLPTLGPVDKRPGVVARIKKKFRLPSNQVNCVPSDQASQIWTSPPTSPTLKSFTTSPVLKSISSSPILKPFSSTSQFKSFPSSPPSLKSRKTSIEFNETDVTKVKLRWTRDKSTGMYSMSFVKEYSCMWGFEWLLGGHYGI